MLKLVVASLIVVATAAATASADTCRDGGHAIASITTWRFTGDATHPQRMDDKLEVLDTGAWRLDVVEDKGRFITHTEGCLAAADLASLRAAIAAADWKLAGNPVACDYASDRTVEYVIGGKHVFDPASPCAAGVWDDVSKRAIAAVDTVAAAARKHP
jgi:hypothetical protein|nr:hypothetical protein [Kofleriaceae bacterium]